MSKIFIIAAFWIVSVCSAQSGAAVDTPVINSNPDVKAEFPGGLKQFYSYITSNFVMPDFDKDFDGKVFFSFVIDEAGYVNDEKILRDPGYGLGEETARLVKASPLWTPASHGGKVVKSLITLPLVVSGKAKTETDYVSAQSGISVDSADSPELVRPSYPGGNDKLYTDFFKNFNTPEATAAVNETVILSFIVNPDGTLSDVTCLVDPGFGLGAECKAALNRISKRWIPGTKDGVAVAYPMRMPIRLSIEAGRGKKTYQKQGVSRSPGPPPQRSHSTQKLDKPW